MSDLLERMRAKLQHARDHRMLAVPIDLEDLEKLIDLAARGHETSYEQLERHVRTAPMTWVPALLIALTKRSVEAKVFVPGGFEKVVEKARASMREVTT